MTLRYMSGSGDKPSMSSRLESGVNQSMSTAWLSMQNVSLDIVYSEVNHELSIDIKIESTIYFAPTPLNINSM